MAGATRRLLELPLCADAERLAGRRAWQQVRGSGLPLLVLCILYGPVVVLLLCVFVCVAGALGGHGGSTA
jgi:hypothetical protein